MSNDGEAVAGPNGWRLYWMGLGNGGRHVRAGPLTYADAKALPAVDDGTGYPPPRSDAQNVRLYWYDENTGQVSRVVGADLANAIRAHDAAPPGPTPDPRPRPTDRDGDPVKNHAGAPLVWFLDGANMAAMSFRDLKGAPTDDAAGSGYPPPKFSDPLRGAVMSWLYAADGLAVRAKTFELRAIVVAHDADPDAPPPDTRPETADMGALSAASRPMGGLAPAASIPAGDIVAAAISPDAPARCADGFQLWPIDFAGRAMSARAITWAQLDALTLGAAPESYITYHAADTNTLGLVWAVPPGAADFSGKRKFTTFEAVALRRHFHGGPPPPPAGVFLDQLGRALVWCRAGLDVGAPLTAAEAHTLAAGVAVEVARRDPSAVLTRTSSGGLYLLNWATGSERAPASAASVLLAAGEKLPDPPEAPAGRFDVRIFEAIAEAAKWAGAAAVVGKVLRRLTPVARQLLR